MAELEFIHGNIKECQQKSIENITTSDSNVAPTFIDTCSLSIVKFSGNCLINVLILEM